MVLRQKENESELQHHKRLVNGKLVDKTLSDIDYTELAEHVYGQAYSSDVARRMMYGSAKTLALIERTAISKTVDDDMLAELDGKRFELQKERVKLQTEKLEYNRWLREDAREELFVEKVADAIRSTDTDCSDIADILVTEGNKTHALFISDAHFGKEFKIHGLKDEIINEFNPEIFYSRMEIILAETIDYIKTNGVTEIKVFNLGDTLDGFLRHNQIWTLRYGVIDSAVIYGKYMAQWLKELSRCVNVEYHPTSGNHTELRLLDGRKGAHVNEDADKVVNEIILIKNEDNPNFTLVKNKTGLIFTQVAGFNLLGIHGEVKNAAVALKDFSDIYGEKIDIIVAGHKHHGCYMNCGYRKHVIGIGSIVGSDDFSISLRKQADASANIVAFEAGRGKVLEKVIILN